MRTRADVEAEMMALVADARSAAAEHDLLCDLLAEWRTIPQQRRP